MVKVMSRPLEDEQTAVVPLDGYPEEKKGNYFCDWLKWAGTLKAVDMRWAILLR